MALLDGRHGIVLGVWILIAPWVLGFAVITTATAAHVVLGVFLIASEAWEIWSVKHQSAMPG